MKRGLVSASKLLFVTALGFAFAIGALQTVQPTFAGGGTCATKHCNANTDCCYGCTANPICVRNGVPCPECAPQ
jgi:hypothetical protein